MKSKINEIRKKTILNLSRKIFVVSLVVISIFACSKKEATGNLHLTGNVEGLGQGKLYISQIQDSTLVVLDSIIIRGNSNFESFLNIENPEVLYLFLDRGQTQSIDNSLPFFAEPGEMTIHTNLKEFYNSAKISGSKNQELWEEFKKLNNRFTEENLYILEKRLQNEINFNKQRQDSIDKAYDKLLKRKYLYVANFAMNHTDFEIAPYLTLTEIADINVALLDSISNKMSPKVAESKYGKMLKEHIKEVKSNP
jgi:hypothetical protein